MQLYKLTNETIDLLSEKIGEMYTAAGCTKKEIYRAKLLLEEAMLKYQTRCGEDVELYFRTYKIFGQMRFCVRLRAPAFDPFTLEENPMAFMIQSIMSTFENGMPSWKYKNLENEVLFTIRKKAVVGSLTKIAISAGVAIVLGILARLILPHDAVTGFVADYITPLTDVYAGLFCVMAVLLTFFAISNSIIHIGDMAAAGAFGGQIMKRFFLTSAIVAVLFTLPILPFFDLSGSAELNVAAKSLYDIIIGFIPTNIVTPFVNFNSVHIMIIGAMFGFSLLTMGSKGDDVVKLFDECNLVAVYTNNFLNKFIFLYVGLMAFGIITTSEFSQLAGAGKMVAAIVIAEIILFVGYTAYVMIKAKVPFSKIAKSGMPPFLVCLSSANFGAAFSTVYDGMMDAGVDTDTANISVNLGSVFFQPACTIVFVFSSLFMAKEYNVEISVVWVIMAIILSVILVGSVPNIPGASVSVITLLYAQLGLPAEALSLMITINALMQFLTVAVDAWCLHCETICTAERKKKAEQAAVKA